MVLAIFAVAAFLFARVQNVWVDETTQLSGITLAPGALLAWLSGGFDPGFGVPPDRMPPVSYFIDMIGWHIWGSNELAFRLYHAAITAGGILVLMVAVTRRFGLRAALIAGLLMALSPKLVTTAVEIRAYPILLTLSCLQVALLLWGDVAAKPKRLALFVLLGVLSGYTHFFGLVATSAYAAAAFLDARDTKGAVRVVLAYGLLLLLWAGLYPFVAGASTISSTHTDPSVVLPDVAAFLAQTLGSSAIMVSPLVATLHFASAALLIVLGAIGLGRVIARDGLEARHEPWLGLLVALLAGIAVTLVASLLVASFDALAPRYSVWMLPPLIVLIAIAADGAMAPPGRLARLTRLGALAVLAISAVWAQALFLSRAEWFIHGPSGVLEQMLAEAPQPVAVVHVGESWAWGYFPLYRAHRDTLPQWLLAPDGESVIRITRGGDPSGDPQPLSVLNDTAALLVSRIDLKTFKDLRLLKDRRDMAFQATGALAPAVERAGWESGTLIHRPGNFTFNGALYRRASPPLPQLTHKAAAPSTPLIEDSSE